MMLHTKYQGPRPCGFRRKDFSCFLGRALVRIRAKKKRKTPFLAELWLELEQK